MLKRSGKFNPPPAITVEDVDTELDEDKLGAKKRKFRGQGATDKPLFNSRVFKDSAKRRKRASTDVLAHLKKLLGSGTAPPFELFEEVQRIPKGTIISSRSLWTSFCSVFSLILQVAPHAEVGEFARRETPEVQQEGRTRLSEAKGLSEGRLPFNASDVYTNATDVEVLPESAVGGKGRAAISPMRGANSESGMERSGWFVMLHKLLSEVESLPLEKLSVEQWAAVQRGRECLEIVLTGQPSSESRVPVYLAAIATRNFYTLKDGTEGRHSVEGNLMCCQAHWAIEDAVSLAYNRIAYLGALLVPIGRGEINPLFAPPRNRELQLCEVVPKRHKLTNTNPMMPEADMVLGSQLVNVLTYLIGQKAPMYLFKDILNEAAITRGRGVCRVALNTTKPSAELAEAFVLRMFHLLDNERPVNPKEAPNPAVFCRQWWGSWQALAEQLYAFAEDKMVSFATVVLKIATAASGRGIPLHNNAVVWLLGQCLPKEDVKKVLIDDVMENRAALLLQVKNFQSKSEEKTRTRSSSLTTNMPGLVSSGVTGAVTSTTDRGQSSLAVPPPKMQKHFRFELIDTALYCMMFRLYPSAGSYFPQNLKNHHAAVYRTISDYQTWYNDQEGKGVHKLNFYNLSMAQLWPVCLLSNFTSKPIAQALFEFLLRPESSTRAGGNSAASSISAASASPLSASSGAGGPSSVTLGTGGGPVSTLPGGIVFVGKAEALPTMLLYILSTRTRERLVQHVESTIEAVFASKQEAAASFSSSNQLSSSSSSSSSATFVSSSVSHLSAATSTPMVSSGRTPSPAVLAGTGTASPAFGTLATPSPSMLYSHGGAVTLGGAGAVDHTGGAVSAGSSSLATASSVPPQSASGNAGAGGVGGTTTTAPKQKILPPGLVETYARLLYLLPYARYRFRFRKMLKQAGGNAAYTLLEMVSYRLLRFFNYTDVDAVPLLLSDIHDMAATSSYRVFKLAENVTIKITFDMFHALTRYKALRSMEFGVSVDRTLVLSLALLLKTRSPYLYQSYNTLSDALKIILKRCPHVWSDATVAQFPEEMRNGALREYFPVSASFPCAPLEAVKKFRNEMSRYLVDGVCLAPSFINSHTQQTLDHYLLRSEVQSHAANSEQVLRALSADKSNRMVFLPVLFMLMNEQRMTLSPFVHVILGKMSCRERVLSQYVLMDFVLQYIPGMSSCTVETAATLISKLCFDYHVLDLDTVVLALADRDTDPRAFGLIEELLSPKKSTFFQRMKAFTGGKRTVYWEEPSAFRTHLNYHKQFSEMVSIMVPGKSTPVVPAVPIYYDNVCLRMLPVMDVLVGRLIENNRIDLLLIILEEYFPLYVLHTNPITFITQLLLYYHEVPIAYGDHKNWKVNFVRLIQLTKPMKSVSQRFIQYIQKEEQSVVECKEYFVCLILNLAKALNTKSCRQEGEAFTKHSSSEVLQVFYEFPTATEEAAGVCLAELAMLPLKVSDIGSALVSHMLSMLCSPEQHYLACCPGAYGGREPHLDAPPPFAVVNAVALLLSRLPRPAWDVTFRAAQDIFKESSLLNDASLKLEESMVISGGGTATGGKTASSVRAHSGCSLGTSQASYVFGDLSFNFANMCDSPANTMLVLLQLMLHIGGVGMFPSLLSFVTSFECKNVLHLFLLCKLVGPVAYRIAANASVLHKFMVALFTQLNHAEAYLRLTNLASKEWHQHTEGAEEARLFHSIVGFFHHCVSALPLASVTLSRMDSLVPPSARSALGNLSELAQCS